MTLRFAYTLALALGIWDVDSLLREMPWSQFRMWMRYHEVEPWGGQQDDQRAGYMTAILYNANRDPKKTTAASASDFFPSLGRGRQQQKRYPLTDPDEWNSVMNMAKVIATAADRE